MDPSVFGPAPSNVDSRDWKQLTSAFSSISSPDFAVKPADFIDPKDLGNDPKLEREWANTAGRHAETYMKLLQSIKDKSKLKLTQHDNDIYAHFRTTFPSLDITNLTEHVLKNDNAKFKWRTFCNEYATTKNNQVQDFNFACLLRLNVQGDYDDSDNVTIVPKIQFLAIEIARNREGRNNKVKGQKYS